MKKNTTMLKQMLQLISRYEFEKAANTYNANKSSKGLSSWNQFIAMVFAQVTNQRSLRGIESGLRANSSSLYHLGITKTSRSTLAYANEHRDYRVYMELYSLLLRKVQGLAPRHKFHFDLKLSSMDATVIDLCKSQFPWADFRKTKSGVKLIVKLSHAGYLPEHVLAVDARRHEKTVAGAMPFDEDEIVVFDRGFSDYKFFSSLYRNGTYFVTRLKSNARFEIIEDISKSEENILEEQRITFTGYYSKKHCPMELRRIVSYDPETRKTIVIITNNFDLSAKVIAEIYKERWQIEIFFKTMKQYLKIKKYYGNSKNSVLTQIFIALIVYLLLSALKFLSKVKISISQILGILRTNAFRCLDIYKLLKDVGKPPPISLKKYSLQGELF